MHRRLDASPTRLLRATANLVFCKSCLSPPLRIFSRLSLNDAMRPLALKSSKAVLGLAQLPQSRARTQNCLPLRLRRTRVCAQVAKEGEVEGTPKTDTDVETVTKKWGLEAGLFKALRSKDGKSGTQQAKELLKKYGSAYLITSISFAIVSFALCYALVNAGVDVSALLANFGLTVGDTGEKVGTAAIAYAAHKALSPVRFPPTVALTPVVANLIGKKVEEDPSDA